MNIKLLDQETSLVDVQDQIFTHDKMIYVDHPHTTYCFKHIILKAHKLEFETVFIFKWLRVFFYHYIQQEHRI